MTRTELLKIRRMIEKASASLEDADALETPELFPAWEVGIATAMTASSIGATSPTSRRKTGRQTSLPPCGQMWQSRGRSPSGCSLRERKMPITKAIVFGSLRSSRASTSLSLTQTCGVLRLIRRGGLWSMVRSN